MTRALTVVGDAIALARPTLMIPLWTMHLLGALHARAAAGDSITLWVPPLQLILLGAGHTLLLGAVYVLNQLADAKSDAANRKLFLIAGGVVSPRFAVVEIAVLLGAATELLAWMAFRQRLGASGIMLYAGSIALGTAYSVPPIRLKARAGWDWIANSVGYGAIAFAVGWLSSGPLNSAAWWTAIPYVWSVGATFAFTTIPDIEGDHAAGDRTLGVALGPRRTAWVGVGCLVLGGLSALAVRNYVALCVIVPSLLLYGRAAWRIHRRGFDSQLTRVTQVVILLLSLVATFGVPLYAAWLAAVVLVLSLYYARRFGVRYP